MNLICPKLRSLPSHLMTSVSENLTLSRNSCTLFVYLFLVGSVVFFPSISLKNNKQHDKEQLHLLELYTHLLD